MKAERRSPFEVLQLVPSLFDGFHRNRGRPGNRYRKASFCQKLSGYQFPVYRRRCPNAGRSMRYFR